MEDSSAVILLRPSPSRNSVNEVECSRQNTPNPLSTHLVPSSNPHSPRECRTSSPPPLCPLHSSSLLTVRPPTLSDRPPRAQHLTEPPPTAECARPSGPQRRLGAAPPARHSPASQGRAAGPVGGGRSEVHRQTGNGKSSLRVRKWSQVGQAGIIWGMGYVTGSMTYLLSLGCN